MAKGIIVVEMPERCSMCRYMKKTNEEYCFCKVEGYGFDYQVNEYMQSKPKGKPDWCPIRSEPRVKPGDRKYLNEYEKGWNDCVDYLEGRNGK